MDLMVGRCPSGTHPGALGLSPQQFPNGGHKRLILGRAAAGQRLPQHRALHYLDLPDRSLARKPVQFHLKRQEAT